MLDSQIMILQFRRTVSIIAVLACWFSPSFAFAENDWSHHLNHWLNQNQITHVSIPQNRKFDEQYNFLILVWQYKTRATNDRDLYKKIHLNGWHIDYGEGKQKLAAWGAQQEWPYYVDHAAGKGILHLTPRSGLSSIPKSGAPSPRPWSFADPKTFQELTRRLDANIPPILNGPVAAIALDDEVSLGSFNSPLEVDYSPQAIAAFRKWLKSQYSSNSAWQRAWQLPAVSESAKLASAQPVTYEKVRQQLKNLPPSKWRLAPWLDFRTFMDQMQAETFAAAVQHARSHAPTVPIGVVGGQQPSAYGGFDYSLLRHSVQWMEAYDIGGTNELLRSFWADTPRRYQMQTYFASVDLARDQWFLWYYLAHGNRGVIAWPDSGGKPWFNAGKINPAVEKLSNTFAAVQADSLQVLAAPQTQPVFSPIALLYSHPSIQVGWAIDATTHGKTWPRRSSSLDNSCLSSGKNRVAWTRLLEDLGHQPRWIDSQELCAGELQNRGIKLLILPQAFALSSEECQAIKAFVKSGGAVIADYAPAITDQHGSGYLTPPLDQLFGLNRLSKSGWFDGNRRFEVDGERYRRPFAERLPQENCLLDSNMPIVERSLSGTRLEHQFGSGRTLYLNLSPTGYFDQSLRGANFGNHWRKWIGDWIAKQEIQEPVRVTREDQQEHGVELLRYRTKDQTEIWAIVANPTRQASVDGPGSGIALSSQNIPLRIGTTLPISGCRNLRTGKSLGTKFPLQLELPGSEAIVLEVTIKP
ncbi:beta-galactosidase [Gimesia aquarii]|uniref:Glycoside hydrolase family 42 N-terminal domain-containing protein n=1 Tax=Gimesia aquarii TaxID=2527964 RepID=A0A517WX86_9PLAN|nr:beta-galactosidase [Gimesia aquarii]QDU09883.1 hypothetical protein V202x_32800 [Gimesia aquarii]